MGSACSGSLHVRSPDHDRLDDTDLAAVLAVADRLAGALALGVQRQRLLDEKDFGSAILDAVGAIVIVADANGGLARYNAASQRGQRLQPRRDRRPRFARLPRPARPAPGDAHRARGTRSRTIPSSGVTTNGSARMAAGATSRGRTAPFSTRAADFATRSPPGSTSRTGRTSRTSSPTSRSTTRSPACRTAGC